MLCVETIGKIRRWHRIDRLSISQIARRLGASRNTVKKYLKSNVTAPKYGPRPKRFPVMGPWAARLLELLSEDAGKALRERRNGQRLYDTLIEEGFPGSYPTLQRAGALGTRNASAALARCKRNRSARLTSSCISRFVQRTVSPLQALPLLSVAA